MLKNKYSLEFKIMVVKYYLNHHTVRETLNEFGIAESVLFEWRKQYLLNRFRNEPKNSNLGTHHLQRKISKIEKILEVQKLLESVPKTTNTEKVKAVDSLLGKYSIKVLCEAVKLPTGTYYNRKRREGKPTQYERNDEKLKPLIKEIFEKSEYRLGKKPIKYMLKEMGIEAGEKRIARLMKEMSLVVQKPSKADFFKKSSSENKFKNKLNNGYSQMYPNQVWVSDITYVRVGNDNKFVCVVIDLFSRKVISFSLSSRIDTMLTIEAFTKAMKERNVPSSLLFHSDQGIQYTCTAFRECLLEYGVNQSFATPGTPTENAVCESFFARMKYEALYRKAYQSLEELTEEVHKYIDYYNNRRPHRFLQFKTPSQIEKEYYSNKNQHTSSF